MKIMKNYYSHSLNSNNLVRCYELATPRVQQFLEAEIEFVKSRCKMGDLLLDLGCGYGRVSFQLLGKVKRLIGIDYSKDNIQLANELLDDSSECEFLEMNALELKFNNDFFDKVICVQNGISAFNVDPKALLKESIRVTKKGGMLLYSSYSEKFWEERLKWFEIQSEAGLIGEIDFERTEAGTIICKDGFKAITYSAEQFVELASNFNLETNMYEIDDSSIFCEMIVK